MHDIQDSELVGDWLLTGGTVRIGLHLHQDGGYAFEQLATDSPHFDAVTASHAGTWLTVPSVLPSEHLAQLWLHMTIESSDRRQPGDQFAWPHGAETADTVTVLVQRHAPGVFNVIDIIDDRFFNAIMLSSDKHEAAPASTQAAQQATATPPPPPPAPRITAPPVTVPPPPAPRVVAPPAASAAVGNAPSQEDVLAGLLAEVEKFSARLTGVDEPSLRERVDNMRQQVKDKQDALALSRQTDALNAEKNRLSAQKDLLDVQASTEAARAKVRQAQAAQQAQFQQTRMQTALDDAKAAADQSNMQAAADAYTFQISQQINTRIIDARAKAQEAFMRATFKS